MIGIAIQETLEFECYLTFGRRPKHPSSLRDSLGDWLEDNDTISFLADISKSMVSEIAKKFGRVRNVS
jgi:hypothetical protein